MDRKRLIMGLIVIIAIPLYVWIAYYEIPGKARIGEEKLQQDPMKHDFEKVLEFESNYMGDASNTSALFQLLPLNEYKGSIEMDPDRFSLVVHYQASIAELGEKAEQAFLYNTTAAFIMLKNLEVVELRFLDDSYKVHRENVEKWFGEEFGTLIEPDVFKEKVQKPLGEPGIDEWLKAYMKEE